MPLVVTGSSGPILRADLQSARPAHSPDSSSSRSEYLQLALINNMPDSALEDTESQFFNLLDAAAENIPVQLKLVALASVPRSDRGMQRVRDCYFGVDELWNHQFDAVIITGTEPFQPDLRNEPYWKDLTQVFDWAERNTYSTVLSCLAAHASVLHSDGISRNPLGDKQFGVFDFANSQDHELTRDYAKVVRFPHSRWNEVRAAALTACGYVVLTQSPSAGVDSFVKKKGKSLFVHFQGHPEYAAQTLLKEYRRDVRRFLRKERETYPTMPHGYFDAAATQLLTDFREKAFGHTGEEVMSNFPETAVSVSLENTWCSSANTVYRKWLHYLLARKTGSITLPALPPTGQARSSKLHTSSM